MDKKQRPAPGRLRKPEGWKDAVDAFIFDMDGVVTDTAVAHSAAWKRLFDDYREERVERGDEGFSPFQEKDYLKHLDGKPRYDGVEDFLASRGIELPWGTPDDDPGAETICGLGNRKNTFFQAWLKQNMVPVFPDAVPFIQSLRADGIKTAIISSSRNCRAVLENAGLTDLFDVRVDGTEMARLDLPGKPDPAIFYRAAELLAVSGERVAVVEDALSGVKAGARGKFHRVIGVDRSGDGDRQDSLRSQGADVVVEDLCELLEKEKRDFDE
ncbi:MAG: beta-phosphoglucomutase family hydrolase [Syntrophotaleaceae bacterium]